MRPTVTLSIEKAAGDVLRRLDERRRCAAASGLATLSSTVVM
jgi:hypothetical protein